MDTPTTNAEETMAAEAAKARMEEAHRRRKRKISAMPSTETNNMYQMLPSYTEQHKAEINEIIDRKECKPCSNAQFNKIFENVHFKIAFSNSRNIKK